MPVVLVHSAAARGAVGHGVHPRSTTPSRRPDSGAGEPAGVVGSRVAAGHHGVTRSALMRAGAGGEWSAGSVAGHLLEVVPPPDLKENRDKNSEPHQG